MKHVDINDVGLVRVTCNHVKGYDPKRKGNKGKNVCAKCAREATEDLEVCLTKAEQYRKRTMRGLRKVGKELMK